MRMTDFSPREIVSELDRFIVGQADAKRAVSIALRNRWRRLQLTGSLREEVLPKNILMIGPTGVGKTEIARRLAKLAARPSSRSKLRNSPKSAMSAATSSRSSATSSRLRSCRSASASARTCRPARNRPPKNACWTRWSDRRRAPPPAIPSARSCAPASSTTRKSRSRRNPPAACRCSKSRACPARRWARFRSAISSERWADEPRPAA